MTVNEDKFAPGPWIPWILALTVWFGWNAFAPDHSATVKDDSGSGVGLVHHADDFRAPAGHSHQLAGLLLAGCGIDWVGAQPSKRLGIEVLRESSAEDLRWDSIQGRAPPFGA
ncbi:hypothetical protein OJ996_24880 [Luteolibacter sp. GHJ8]|uniref:Uncharacterized protein n=1 Tax=Luteolibacter rhizosphaerae TaxID=2989719 RepID=A0ABT3GB40_9BACT|nr:hypothetical protein [Luteolibacter rhizosphaerae]MCW1916847.1 hypothetical protein [Luteolibacter rhizosphaerae]